MAEKKLFFTVGADVGPGTKAFASLARDAKKSMGDVDDAVTDTRTNAQRVADALDGVFEQVDATMKETAETAEVLGRAMGPELAAKVDTTAAIQEFQRLGLSMDEIRADADRLADTLKKADDVTLRNFTGEADHARAKTDELGKSADSSKSVMANMVGNSAQDLGELGGIAGSAGVAFGQMGEYMVDARNDGDKLGDVMRNFGAVAGPIALLTVAVSAVGSIFKASGERAERAKEQVDAFTDSLGNVDDATAAVEGLADQMSNFDADARTAWGGFVEGVSAAAEAIPLVGGLIGDAGQNVSDVIPTFLKLGISARDIGQAAAEGGTEWDKLQVKLWGAQEIGQITSAEYAAASQVLYGFRDSAEAAAKVNEFLGEEVKGSGIEAKAAALRIGAGVVEMQKWAEESTAAAEASKTFAEETGTIEFGLADIAAGLSAMSSYNDMLFAAADQAQVDEEAFDNLSASVKENGETFDVTTEAGRANQDALEDVARALEDDLAKAYQTADGDQDTFMQNAGKLAHDTLGRLQKELGLTDDETFALGKQLGLLPEDLETRYKLSGSEEARIKIGLLQGSIEALPKDVQARVTQQIITGDYVGAVRTVQGYFNSHPTDIPSSVENPTNMAAVRNNVQGYFNGHPVSIGARVVGAQVAMASGGTAGPDGAIAGEAGPEFINPPSGGVQLLTGPAIVPPGTHVTSTRRTRQILSRRYENGTRIPATAGVGSVVNVNLSVNVAAGANPVAAGQQILDVLVPALRTGGAGRLRRELGLAS